jgi:hypothetical protein
MPTRRLSEHTVSSTGRHIIREFKDIRLIKRDTLMLKELDTELDSSLQRSRPLRTRNMLYLPPIYVRVSEEVYVVCSHMPFRTCRYYPKQPDFALSAPPAYSRSAGGYDPSGL